MLIMFYVQILCWEEVMFHGSKALEETEIEVVLVCELLPEGLFRVNVVIVKAV